jgi:hypothetical protein
MTTMVSMVSRRHGQHLDCFASLYKNPDHMVSLQSLGRSLGMFLGRFPHTLLGAVLGCMNPDFDGHEIGSSHFENIAIVHAPEAWSPKAKGL